MKEIEVCRLTLRLARTHAWACAGIVALGFVAVLMEAVGLSFLIPLTRLATGEAAGNDVPLVGWMLAILDDAGLLTVQSTVALVLSLFLGGQGLTYLNVVLSNKVAMRFAHALRLRVFEMILRKRVTDIEAMEDGVFINTLASETWRACDALFAVLGGVVQIVTVACLVGFLFAISTTYTLILLAMVGVTAVVVFYATRAVRRLGEEAVAANERFMNLVWDVTAGLRVVRAMGSEPYERGRFAEASATVRDVFIRMQVRSGAIGPLGQVMAVMMVALIIGVGLTSGDDLGIIAGFLAIAYRLHPRAVSLMQTRAKLMALSGPLAAVRKALESASEEADAAQGMRALAHASRIGEIVLDDVEVVYPGAETAALRGVSCRFRRGAVTAVVGPSGAGKSTIVALVLGFLRPTVGRVVIDGVPLDGVDPASWKAKIAYVDQGAYLFAGSVRDNIAYAMPDADDAAVERAACAAQAHDFIVAMEDGYATMLRPGGRRLSSGQRQRIAMARALMRQPEILILDEAMNALDEPTEQAMRMAVAALRPDAIIIVIAHRRSTVEIADEVIVIRDGLVAEQGSFAELARRGGVLAELFHTPDDEEAPLR